MNIEAVKGKSEQKDKKNLVKIPREIIEVDALQTIPTRTLFGD